MKRSFFLLGVLFFLSLPFLYNSCQKQKLEYPSADKSYASCVSYSTSTSGKLDPFSSKSEKSSKPKNRSMFHEKKIHLDLENSPKYLKHKAKNAKHGFLEAVALIDNRCVENYKATNSTKHPIISMEMIANKPMSQELDQQSYSFSLDNFRKNQFQSRVDQDSCVIGVSYNQIYKVHSLPLSHSFNDTYVSDQHHLLAIKAADAYTLFFPAHRQQISSVKIAIVDTGVSSTHPDLEDSFAGGINATAIGLPGSGNYNDLTGHGSHIAGLAVAASNNNYGVVGAMKQGGKYLSVLAFKNVVDENGNTRIESTSEYVANGIIWAAQNGADVINLSLGSESENGSEGPNDILFKDSIRRAVYDYNVVVVSSVGNSKTEGRELGVNGFFSSPSRYASGINGFISVGSYDIASKSLSDFSHYSPVHTEISAPGSNGAKGLLSTTYYKGAKCGEASCDLSSGPDYPWNYDYLSGTSQAAPLVSAAAGLVINAIRDAYQLSNKPSPAEVEWLIKIGSQELASLEGKVQGSRVLDLKVLAEAMNEFFPKTKNPTDERSYPTIDSTCL